MTISKILEDQAKRDLSNRVDLSADGWVEEKIEESTECLHANTYLAWNGPDDYKTVCKSCGEES